MAKPNNGESERHYAGPLSQAIAAEIRAALGRKQWSNRELARRLGVHTSWVSNRVRARGGKSRTTIISANDLEAIADALGMSWWQLIPPRGTSMPADQDDGGDPEPATRELAHA